MPTKAIPYVKVLVHLFCIFPVLGFYHWYSSGQMAAAADPVNDLTHWTGNWALWLLIASLAVTPLRRLHPKLSNLIRFRRLLGLYAFFYATLHLATYVFLYSGYDVLAAWAGVKQGHLAAVVTQWKVIWPNIADDLLKRRFIQLGLFSWVILLGLALTSPLFMLRWMGGKNWQRLHRLVYLAAIGGVVHYWWIVKRGVTLWVPDAVVLTVLLLARVAWWAWKRRSSGRPAAQRMTT
jgi:sulfoxide reductase heme-binding subunit YedZ